MADSPWPPHSRRRSTDPPGEDNTARRRPPLSGNGGFFEGETRSEIRHLAEAIERLDSKLDTVATEVTNLRLFRAKILGQAGVIASGVSLVISLALAILGWLKGAR